MITKMALLRYRHGEACDLLESIFQPMVQSWFFPLGCYIPQSRVKPYFIKLPATVASQIDGSKNLKKLGKKFEKETPKKSKLPKYMDRYFF